MQIPFELSRRDLLAGSAVLPLLACAPSSAAPPATSSRLITGTICPATPRQTEGPFYFDPQLVRRDIREGRPGTPLTLRLQIVDASDCGPAARARVDIWHCDAAGAYSGYDRERTAGERWLRGTQVSDAEGVVSFQSLYPGWYQGRAPHIHVKAWTETGRELTAQAYFPDALSDRIYGDSIYAQRDGRRLRNGDDFIFRRTGEHPPLIAMAEASNGLAGAIVIALG